MAWAIAGCSAGHSAENVAPSPLAKADHLAVSGDLPGAVGAYDAFIEENAAAKDPEVQDRVARARVRKGYALAKQKNWREARAVLLQAEREYKGTGKMVPGEGGAKDEAAYQAAVCLIAMGNKAAGVKALLDFVDRYPDSPNTGGAYKRLMRLTSGQEKDRIAKKFDQITAAQAERLAMEMAKCGPRAIAYVARMCGKAVPSEATLAKACRTDKLGTSIAGMAAGLELCGLKGYGYSLNRKDFGSLRGLAIWLRDEHFLVITHISGNTARVYDAMTDQERAVAIPNEDDSHFSANVLALERQTLSPQETS